MRAPRWIAARVGNNPADLDRIWKEKTWQEFGRPFCRRNNGVGAGRHFDFQTRKARFQGVEMRRVANRNELRPQLLCLFNQKFDIPVRGQGFDCISITIADD